jgi:hypothetical protein
MEATMALTEEEADDVVQKSIPEAGGFEGPHHGRRTLNGAGLVEEPQRVRFRRRVTVNTREDFNHTIQPNELPGEASTTVAEARRVLQEKARAR